MNRVQLFNNGIFTPCREWDIYHINWCRISSINSMFQYLGDFHIIAWTRFTNKKVSQVLTQPLTKKPSCNCKYQRISWYVFMRENTHHEWCWRQFTKWWFQICFNFHPYLGKIPILTNMFQMGWNHQPVYHPLQRWWMDHFITDWESFWSSMCPSVNEQILRELRESNKHWSTL